MDRSHGGVGAYPGAACDVSAYTYLPLLDRTKFIPSKKYIGQTEICEYCKLLVETTGIADSIQLGRRVTHVEFAGMGDGRNWRVSTVDAASGHAADTVSCKHVITANGPLSSPRMPDVEGTRAHVQHTALHRTCHAMCATPHARH